MDNLIKIMKIFALGGLIWAGVYGIATLICANAPRKQAEAEDVSPLHDGAVAGALFD